jgi:expansin (peptidoglycan-binding protein)
MIEAPSDMIARDGGHDGSIRCWTAFQVFNMCRPVATLPQERFTGGTVVQRPVHDDNKYLGGRVDRRQSGS